MKRLVTAAVALSLLGGSAALAQPYGHERDRAPDQRGYNQQGYDQRGGDQRGYDQRGNGHDRGHHYGQQRRWARGERLPAQYYSNRSYYVDYRAHHLRRPPYGYRWVQVDNNYLMVAAATGLIAQIIANQ